MDDTTATKSGGFSADTVMIVEDRERGPLPQESGRSLRAYAIGYGGRSVDEVVALVERYDAVLADIRLVPTSRRPEWSRRNLEARFGEKYVHVKSLGNRNYKGGPIEIVDMEAGIDLITGLSHPAILLCVCRDGRSCHRAVVAQAMRQRGYSVEELDVAHIPPRQGLLPL